MSKHKFFRVVLEDGRLWVDGIEKRAGTNRHEFFKHGIEKVVGEGMDTHGLFEVCDGGPYFYPDETQTQCP